MSTVRRQSQNSRMMREILTRLRDYDVDEIRTLCQKHLRRKEEAALRALESGEDP